MRTTGTQINETHRTDRTTSFQFETITAGTSHN